MANLSDILALHQAAATLTAGFMSRTGGASGAGVIDDPTLKSADSQAHWNLTWQVHMAFYYALAGVLGTWPAPAAGGHGSDTPAPAPGPKPVSVPTPPAPAPALPSPVPAPAPPASPLTPALVQQLLQALGVKPG